MAVDRSTANTSMQPAQTCRLAALALLLIAGFPLLPTPNFSIPAIAQTVQDRKAGADRLLKQGIQQAQTSQFEAALHSWQQALQICRAVKDRLGEGIALHGLGMAYQSLNNYSRAIEYQEQSLAIARQIKNRLSEGDALSYLGLAYYSLGNYAKAIEYEGQSLVIARKIKDRGVEGFSLRILGLAYYSLGGYGKAVYYQQQRLVIARELKDRLGEGNALGNLSNAYQALGNYAKATEYHQQSLAIARELKDRQREGKAESDRSASLSWHEFISTEGGFRVETPGQLTKQVKSESQSPIYLFLLTAENVVYLVQYFDIPGVDRFSQEQRQQLLDEGTKSFVDSFGGKVLKQQTVQLDGVAGREVVFSKTNGFGRARFYLIHSRLYIIAGAALSEANLSPTGERFLNSFKLLKPAAANSNSVKSSSTVALEQTTDPRQAEADRLFQQGHEQFQISQFAVALQSWQQALQIYRQITDRRSEATVLSNLGSAYSSLSNYGKAIEYQEQSLAIFREIKARLPEGNILGNLGLTYKDLGNYSKAIKYHEQALVIAREINDRTGEGAALENLGFAYQALGNNSKAIEYHKQALVIAREIKARYGEETILNNLGNVYSALGNYSKAIKYHEQALVIAREIKNRTGEGSTLGNLGNAHDAMDNYSKAIGYRQQGLAIARKINARSQESIILNNIGAIFARQQKPELAIGFYKQAVNVRESIRKDIRSLSREEQASYTQLVASTYRNLADLLLQQNRVMEALQVLDLLKVQELQDYLSDIKGNQLTQQGVPLLPQEREIVQAFNQNSAISKTISNPAVKALVGQLRQTAAAQNLTLPAYKDLQTRIQKLGKNIALFYPLILDDRLELVLFIPDRPPIRKTVNVKRVEFEREIGTFRQLLTDSTKLPKARQSAQKLYTWLVQPIDAELKAANVQTIVYAPDGQMRYIPLAALHDGTQWLTQRYQINYLTALALTPLDTPAARSPSALTGALTQAQTVKVVGKTYDFSPLPSTQAEVAQVAKTIPNTKALIDQPFNRVNLLAQMPQATIVHLATHAKFGGTPEESFIVLGDGDVVTLREIEAWKLPNVSLFVLSACETGLGGKLGNGLEILGFGYQMQRTGSRAAIASLWAVADDGTSVLMNSFYAALQTGMPKAQALQQAQAQLIAHPNYSHPLYWAPFILIGNGL